MFYYVRLQQCTNLTFALSTLCNSYITAVCNMFSSVQGINSPCQNIALHGYEKEPVIDKQHKDPFNCILTIIIIDTVTDFSLR